MARPRTHAGRWRRSSGCPLAVAQWPGGGAHEDGERAEQPVAHMEGHEEARGPGNGSDGELGPPAMADARSGVEGSERKRVRSGALARTACGSSGAWLEKQGRNKEAVHMARKLGNGGHVHGHAASFKAFYRARGGRRYG